MRIDFKIALYGLGFGFGIAVVAMILPLRFPNIPPLVLDIMLLGGGTIALSSFLLIIYELFIRPRLAKEVKMIPLAMIMCGFLLIIGGVICHIVDKNPSYTKEKHFSVSLDLGIMGGLNFAYESTNRQFYYIDILLCVDLVNKANVFSRINDYYAQIFLDGKWVKLQRIPLSDSGRGQFFNIQNKSTYRGNSIEFDYKTIDEQINKINLEPGKTTTGIMMFYLEKNEREKYIKSKLPLKIKVVIIDSLRNIEEHIINIENNKPDINKMGMGFKLAMKIIKTDIDLKSFSIINDY